VEASVRTTLIGRWRRLPAPGTLPLSLDSGDQIDDALSQSIRLVVQRGKRSLRGGPALIDSAGTRPARALPLEERGSRLGH